MRLAGRVKPQSLAAKLSLASALLVTVSLGALSILTVTASRQSLREQVLAANLTAATLAARAVEQYVADAMSIMREAPGRPKLSREIHSANWPEAAKVLENFLRHFSQFDYVFIQDAQGVIRVRVPHAETVGQDFSFREFFREATRTRRPYLSGVYVSKAARRPVVSSAVPVLDADGAVRGVLVGALSLGAMSRFVSAIGQEHGSRVYIVDGHGVLVAHSEGLGADSPVDMTALAIVQAVMTGQSGRMEFQEAGSAERWLGAYVPVGQLGWGVVVAKPASVAYAPADRLGRWLVVIALGCLAGAVLLGWGFAHMLTGPLSRIAAAAERLGTGDLSARAGLPHDAGELGRLARTFDEMAASLERHDAEAERAAEEIRQLNAELEQRVIERTAQLEAVNQELEAFTYTVSHDLKAPLRGMEGFARVLLEDYADRLDETGRRYLGTIQTGAQRMGELIDDLLRYSRLERREMRRERVPLQPLLEQVCDGLAGELRARGLTIRMELTVEAVEGEREGLREALANLVENAVKFSRDGGGPITIGSRREGETITLSVADTGIGFDMKYHDRIFGIFERLHRQEEYPGTGVGLAIVRKVAERHGGRVWAVSEPGKGSTFYLALPLSAGGAG